MEPPDHFSPEVTCGRETKGRDLKCSLACHLSSAIPLVRLFLFISRYKRTPRNPGRETISWRLNAALLLLASPVSTASLAAIFYGKHRRSTASIADSCIR
uniref:Uncharacterized protein n=1 Tax=Sphaerodactylus townsendi TaxID=933632 RepID=A0ACB8FND0_9SAUR